MERKPRLLDLFCGAGGAAMGYHRAGFEVVGVDIKPQPRYPFEFVQADALDLLVELLCEWGDDYQVPESGRTTREGLNDGIGELVRATTVGTGNFDVQMNENGAGHEEPPVDCFPSSKAGFSCQDFDAIHASPPCQAFTSLKVMHNAREHDDLLTPTRQLVQVTGLPYVIENVPGAPIATLTRLCGTSFGLGVEVYDGWRELRRHRYFETSFSLMSPPCWHRGPTIGFYGDHARDRRRVDGKQAGLDFPGKDKLELGRKAMGMPWVEKWREITEAIPPAYTEFIGEQLMAHLRATVPA